MIKRDYYLKRMMRNMWNGEVKVITGIRRCGKSVLLFDLFYQDLLSQGVQDDHIIKIELTSDVTISSEIQSRFVNMLRLLLQKRKMRSFISSLTRCSLPQK